MIESDIRVGGRVSFPSNNAERVYMLPFFQRSGLPPHLSRWQQTVDQMLAGIHSDAPIYLMIDQAVVRAGHAHRREGLHVEGNWDDRIRDHKKHRHHQPYDTEMVILASDVVGCRALIGTFEGEPGAEGQCQQIDLRKGREVILDPFMVYRGTVTTVHESLPMTSRTSRTLVRLNLPAVHL